MYQQREYYTMAERHKLYFRMVRKLAPQLSETLFQAV